ncbi:MAG: hypothetical protein AMXMBFR47_44990 [Planctomycetota bacterium]
MRTTALRKRRFTSVRNGVAAGIGLALSWMMAGCPADVTGSVTQVTGELVGITKTPASGPPDGGTVVTFISDNGGFDAQTSVLFGNKSAAEVRVYNENVMTAVAPPNVASTVTVTLHAPIDSQLRVVINDQGVGTVREIEQRSIKVTVGTFAYQILTTDNGTDSDGDGLTNVQEQAGWEVWIDSFALAPDGTSYLNTLKYQVVSNAFVADTDGDGLADNVEFQIKSDPGKKDSDGDGLWDAEEWNQWLTSPTSVDTDGDSRGDPEHPLAPNQALFDGLEMYDSDVLALPALVSGNPNPARTIKARATSPTLSDTDGDGVSDFDEFDSTVRNGVIADLPLLNHELVGDMDVRLNVEYAESVGETHEYGTTLTESQTRTVASEYSSTLGWSFAVMVRGGYEDGSGYGGFEVTAGVHGDYTWTNSQESSRQASKEKSRIDSDSKEFTETSSDGSIRTAILLKNGGNTTFTVENLGVLLQQRPKQARDTTLQPQFKSIATLTPVFDSVTLAPGETAGPFELAATGVNADSIKALLAAPDTLIVNTASMEFTDASGLNFDYVRQFTAAQTAQLVIDFGKDTEGRPNVRQYTVATNVDRNPDSTYRGIALKRVFEDYLGLAPNDAADGYTLMPGEGSQQVLQSLQNFLYSADSTWWDVVWVDSEKVARINPDFNSIVLKAGDYVHLTFQTKTTKYGVTNNVAGAAGIDQLVSVADGDADGDGLSNQREILDGWVVFAAPTDTGIQWANEVVSASSSRAGHPASAALNAPDTNVYGSAATAWSPNLQNGSRQWIDVRVPTNVYASGVTIRETWGNGFVYQVDAADAGAGGVLRTVWKGSDSALPGAAENVRLTWPTTDFLTRRVRIYVDTDANLDTWEEIDAIAIHGYADKRAHRVFSDPRTVDTDSDGRTDAEEYAGATADPALFVSSDPLNPDTDGDGLLDGVDPFPTIAAKTKYVRAGAVAGGNGNSWDTAYQTIQSALTATTTGQGTPTNPNDDVSQIWVASGVYKPSARTSPITLLNKVNLFGGFAGSGPGFAGETKLGQRNSNPFSNGCVLTGDGVGSDVPDVGSIDLDTPGTRNLNCPVVLFAGPTIDRSSLVDGFMITGAYAKTTDVNGGALHVEGAPTIQNCLFTGNGNQGEGGGVQFAGLPVNRNAVFRKCVFAGNVAHVGGGVAFQAPGGGSNQGLTVFEDCEFSQNEARALPIGNVNDGGARGGGVFKQGTDMRIDFLRCAFTGNSAWAGGGGLDVEGSSGSRSYCRIDTCRFYNNRTETTNATYGRGGGLLAFGETTSVSNSVFWDNRATSFGGGIMIDNLANITITNCTIAYNRSGGTNPGGGIYAGGNPALIENTIAWQNYYGTGAIPDPSDSAAPTESQQIYRPGSLTVRVRNCCLNGPPAAFAGGGNINADPAFIGLPLGNLSLGDESPCIDRGNSFVDLDPLLTGYQLLPVFDLAGLPRIADGNGDGIIAVDIGAYEAPAPN